MAELKTKPTDVRVEDYLASVEHPRRQADAREVVQIMTELTGHPATMWGNTMIGFGRYNYTYDSGHSGTAMRIGLAPRKANLVLYIMDGYTERDELLAKLGKFKRGKSCLYLNKLDDIDRGVLRELIQRSLAEMQARYPE